MTTIQKQRLFWVAGLALAAVYFAPSIFHSNRPAVNGQQGPGHFVTPQAGKGQRPLPAPGAPAPPSGPAGISPDASGVATAPTQSDNLLGIWQGIGPLPGQGICNLKLELRRSTEPDRFSGFPVLICMPLPQPLVQRGRNIQNPIAQMTPLSAVLTGTAKDGGIQFNADKIIGRAMNGCGLTSLTVTPFGTDQIAAEWQEGTCQGGQILMRRTSK
jgi:hypothetical protein